MLEKVTHSDGVIIGSPICYRNITGQLHFFYERLLFPYTVYSAKPGGIKRMDVPFGFVYTMNVTEEVFLRDRYEDHLRLWERFSGNIAGHHYVFNTYQFDDYGKYVSDCFSEIGKSAYREALITPGDQPRRRSAFSPGESQFSTTRPQFGAAFRRGISTASY